MGLWLNAGCGIKKAGLIYHITIGVPVCEKGSVAVYEVMNVMNIHYTRAISINEADGYHRVTADNDPMVSNFTSSNISN